MRAKVGNDFHFQMKISAQEFADALTPLHIGSSGNTLEDSIQVCKWLVEAGIDAIHVSTGALLPAPEEPVRIGPAGRGPGQELRQHDLERRAHVRQLPAVPRRLGRAGAAARGTGRPVRPSEIEGKNLPDARAIKAAVTVPVICTGGFQTASVIEKAIKNGDCDAVSMARTLVANNDLPKVFASGKDKAEKPCTYCNRCLVNVVENPLGCYDVTRFPTREAMVAQIMSVFDPPAFVDQPAAV